MSNEAGNADDPENVPIISIPEDPYQVSYGSWFTFFEGKLLRLLIWFVSFNL